jgi:hypothetical protein
MDTKNWIRIWVVLLAVWSVGTTVSAQDWARDMFNHTSHDFGTVARGAKVEHRFTLENMYLEDAHIASAHVSCGCTSPEVPTQLIKTWDKAEVIARVNTQAYLGQKDVTITVVFDKPFPAEVQLQIHCYIRSDVVVQPGSVQFGAVTQGAGGRQKVTVSYAGRQDWQVQRVECVNPSVTAQPVEVSRGGGMVTYDLLVSLAQNAPAGYIRDQLVLVTNDNNPRAARVPIPVDGVVRPGITVHPSPLYMGAVEAGKSVSRQLVIRGGTPFKITRVQSSDPRFHCEVPTTPAILHRLPVTFQASESPGKVVGRIQIETDTGGSPLDAEVNVQVVSPSVADQSDSKGAKELKTPAADKADAAGSSGKTASGAIGNVPVVKIPLASPASDGNLSSPSLSRTIDEPSLKGGSQVARDPRATTVAPSESATTAKHDKTPPASTGDGGDSGPREL